MQADETALPSECLQSYQACIALRGRQEWWLSDPGQSKSEFTAAEKLKHLDAAHTDLSHLRGRDGIVGVLKEELGDRVWPHLVHDATFFVLRCEECRARSTRGTADSQPRHLPRPNSSGEVVGWDLKKITPLKGHPWVMLLAVDFASNKAFAWDLDQDKISLQHVQSIMLRFAQSQDAMHEAFGVKARHIPPGHPQSNGLVEVHNRILDFMHGGQRDRLVSAVIAFNNCPGTHNQPTPETIWRVLRPTTSRWQHAGTKALVHGKQPMTDAEWETFLEQHQKIMGEGAAGDAKFQHAGGERREYLVRKVNGGLVEVEEIGTGVVSTKHEAQLKLMPKAVQPDKQSERGKWNDSSQPCVLGSCATVWLGADGEKWRIFAVEPDGACFYQSASVREMKIDGGPRQHSKPQVIEYAKKWYHESPPKRKRLLRAQIMREMEEDPTWMESHAVQDSSDFDMDAYFEYQKKPYTFATFFNVAAFARLTGVPTIVYRRTEDIKNLLTKSWEEDGEASDGDGGEVGAPPLRVLLSPNHYDLLFQDPKDAQADDAADDHSATDARPTKRRRMIAKTSGVKKRPASRTA
ncbi:unnamed protein product [Prorocentrum cordatum]|uniref:Ubiquitinyl hydrolase 1 n=1 Tax=Prorocentrum cordatum TaxID=2364126 RepID=A0ABN9PNL0_9DINO|nr:unnamed protein product [Polarella glacialis]